MDRWGNLNMQQKAQLLGIYASKGYTDLASIINHYNTFQAGGKLTFNEWKSQMQSKYPNIEMDNTKAGYDYVRYFNDNYDDAIRQLSNLQHFPDTYKLPNHPTFSNESIYSRGPMMGGNWVNDSTFTPSTVNRQYHPDIYKENRNYTEREIYSNNYQKGGFVDNKSDWAKAHETELVLHQLGWGNPDNRLHSDYAAKDDNGYYAGYNLKPVTIVAEHPIRKYDKTVNLQDPNFNDLYQHYLNREEAGKEYLKRVAGGLSIMALPIGGAAGFILGVPDLATDFAEMTDKPSVSNATELTLDAPTRYGTELDNALISVLKSNKYTKPLAKILQYNDALQYIGAANDAASAVTGKSIIERVSK